MSGMSENSAFEAFARMEEKITANERQLQAAQEIDEEFSGDQLAGQFKQLERSSGGATADVQLLQLKQRMGMLSAGAPAAAKQLAAGATEAAPAAEAPAALPASTPDRKTGEAELLAEFEQLRNINPRS
jgi:phage shock protein A